MKIRIQLPLALLAILASGCATKSPYDVSAAEVQKHRGAPPMMKGGPAHTPGMSEVHFKKGETLPDGTIAQNDVTVAREVKHFKKGDILPDGKVSDGDRQFDRVLMKRAK